MGDKAIVHPVTVPRAAVAAAEVVPALQGIVNAAVASAEAGLAKEGRTVSCRKGCAACCRLLVPVSRTEGEALLGLIDAMPAERRAVLAGRFEAASRRLSEAGLRERLLDPGRRTGSSDRELSLAYSALGIACPFLDEEVCSIHGDRPLVCREYLVTSPAELCSSPTQAGVTAVPVPKLSVAARGVDEDRAEANTTARWFPLALLPDWSKSRPTRSAPKRPGPEWVERFLRRMAR
ncbi:MAG: YkgJ family cysteine cluster protein [Alphaproteobacteria bacterium]|nr:YkgJ family cysteine cluster protein [Alphaproteobacteria bacterium]